MPGDIQNVALRKLAALDAADVGIGAATEAHRVIGERFGAGVATSTDVVDAQVAVLQAQGFVALELHGDLDQRDRDQVLVQFTNRSCSVLVATDVAARGLDIAQLAAVINVDITPDVEVHTHRVGRTGRGEHKGQVFNLVSVDEMGRVGRIDDMQGRASRWHALSELTPAGGPPLRPTMVTLQIVGGRKDKIRAGDVLGALTKDLGLPGAQIGKINVNEFSTYVALDPAIADKAVRGLNSGRIKGKAVKVRQL